MNALERAECLLDAGSSGNMNFTVIASYRGRLEPAGLQNALAALQGRASTAAQHAAVARGPLLFHPHRGSCSGHGAALAGGWGW